MVIIQDLEYSVKCLWRCIFATHPQSMHEFQEMCQQNFVFCKDPDACTKLQIGEDGLDWMVQ